MRFEHEKEKSMSKGSKISVIIPVFNAELTIERCLDSIRRQTYRNLEIIIINDASTDESLKRIKQFQEMDERIKIIDEKVRGGVGMARNSGLNCAEGKYIVFVDSDDYVEENYVEALYGALVYYKADISICECQGEFEDCRVNKSKRERRCTSGSFSVSEGYSYTTYRNHRVVWGGLYKKKVIQNIQFAKDLYVGEDTLFFAMAARQAEKIAQIGLKLYHYVQYEESAYHGRFSNEKITELEAWRRVCRVFEDVPKVYISAKCEYTSVCFEMMKKYCGDLLFQREYYKATLKEYRRNVKYFFKNEDVIIPKKIFRVLIALFPDFFAKYW